MSEPLDDTIYDALTSSAPASPANPSASPVSSWLKPTSDGSGRTSSDSFASFDPATSVWKMSQGSLFTDSEMSLGTWPKQGMTRSGRAYARPMWVRPTVENGCSSWLTPTQNDSKGSDGKSSEERWTEALRNGATVPTTVQRLRTQAAMSWPTPTESDSGGAGNRNLPGSKAHAGTSLTDAVTGGQAPRQWPTPRAEDSESSGARVSRGTADTLTAVTRMEDWRTPSSRYWKGPSAQSWRDRETGDKTATLPDQLQTLAEGNWPTPQAYAAPEGMGKPTSTPLDQAVRDTVGLPVPESLKKGGNLRASSVVLNPAWVSCLMGYPPDWCDIGDGPLPRSATASSRKPRTSSPVASLLETPD